MRAYTVHYTMHQLGEVREVSFLAENKREAYYAAYFEAIPKQEGTMPYSAWVHSVTSQNGNYHTFNNFEGKPY